MQSANEKKVAAVVGVGSGLGAALARRFAAGYKTVLIARSAAVIEPVAEEIRTAGGIAVPIQSDATIEEQISATREKIRRELGPMEILIYNGGRHRHRGGHCAVLSARVEAWDRAARRCALPLPNPYGLGQRDVLSVPLRRVRRGRGVAHRVRARGSSVRQAPRACDGDRATDLQVRAPWLRATKAAALAYLQQGERVAVDAIPSIEKAVFATEDFKEGIQSFVERREARFQGR